MGGTLVLIASVPDLCMFLSVLYDCCISLTCFHVLAMTYPGVFQHVHVFADLFVDISIIHLPFKLISLFLKLSSLVITIRDFVDYPGLFLLVF